jgi:hypothetical protein
MNEPRFEVYPRHRIVATESSPVGPEFGWRFRAANGQISAVSGEGFTRREDAHRAISDFTVDVGCNEMPAPIVDTNENGDRIEASS